MQEPNDITEEELDDMEPEEIYQELDLSEVSTEDLLDEIRRRIYNQ